MTTPANPPADLVTWLRAQLDEDERVARESVGKGSPEWTAELDVKGGGAIVSDGNGYRLIKPVGELDIVDADHIARHDPGRVLAEVDAKRRILDWLEDVQRFMDLDEMSWYRLGGEVDIDLAHRLLALPFAGRPGFREEWKPT